MIKHFGHFKLHRLVHTDGDNIEYHICECSCGNVEVVGIDKLESGASIECVECANIRRKSDAETHGFYMSRHALYNTWRNMIDRCDNKDSSHYSDYGGRDISVCPSWYNFYEFIEDMGKKPDPRASLERRNNNGHYTPQNCYWGTDFEQANNKRNTNYLTFGGITYPRGVWRLLLTQQGIAPDVAEYRLKQSWYDLEELFSGLRNSNARDVDRKLHALMTKINKDY